MLSVDKALSTMVRSYQYLCNILREIYWYNNWFETVICDLGLLPNCWNASQHDIVYNLQYSVPVYGSALRADHHLSGPYKSILVKPVKQVYRLQTLHD